MHTHLDLSCTLNQLRSRTKSFLTSKSQRRQIWTWWLIPSSKYSLSNCLIKSNTISIIWATTNMRFKKKILSIKIVTNKYIPIERSKRCRKTGAMPPRLLIQGKIFIKVLFRKSIWRLGEKSSVILGMKTWPRKQLNPRLIHKLCYLETALHIRFSVQTKYLFRVAKQSAKILMRICFHQHLVGQICNPILW